MEHYSAGGPQILLESRHRMQKRQISPLQWCDITTPATAQTNGHLNKKQQKIKKKSVIKRASVYAHSNWTSSLFSLIPAQPPAVQNWTLLSKTKSF